MKPIASCWLQLQRWPALSPSRPPHLDTLMKRPLRSSDQDGLEGSAGFTGFSRVIDVPRRLCPLISSNPV